MPKYAVIVNDCIENVIVADSKEDAELLSKKRCEEVNESFNFGAGAKFDGEKWYHPESENKTLNTAVETVESSETSESNA